MYKENVGTVSPVFQPEKAIMWSLLDIFKQSNTDDPDDVYLISPCFSFLEDEWYLALSILSGRYCCLFLCKLHPPICEYDVKLSMKNMKNISGKLDSYGHFGVWNFVDGYKCLRSRRAISPNGFLKIFCEIKKVEVITESVFPLSIECPKSEKDDYKDNVEEDVPISKGIECPKSEKDDDKDNVEEDVPISKGLDRLVENLGKLLLEGQNSDVTLKVENREFPVHKGILGARSPVFASMFQHDMAEKNSDVVDIPDCSSEAFEVFLRFLYTGSSEAVSVKNAFDLYYISDKYQVDDLKEDCVEFMKNSLSVDTFYDVIDLSLRHSESGLQEEATNFFRENVKEIVKTVKWLKYLQNNPIQANELYIKAINA